LPDLKPKPFAFVLMPFSEDFDDIYQVGIKPACERAGAYAERVDEQVFQGSILQRIYNQISKADLVIADMTGRNPNVFYETGYAHALGRPVILLAQSAADIPFDLKHYPHLIYNRRIVDLLPELERRVRVTLDAPASTSQRFARVLVDSTEIVNHPVVSKEVRGRKIGFALSIDINNEVGVTVRPLACQVGLITSSQWQTVAFSDDNRVTGFPLAQEHRLFLLDEMIELLPGSWKHIAVTALTANRTLSDAETHDMAIRLLTSAGYEDYEFSVLTQLLPESGR
jgi:hypothetical protein